MKTVSGEVVKQKQLVGATLLSEILDQSGRVGAKSPIFDLFARSDSAVTPSEKKFN